MNNSKRYYIETFGCQMNDRDSEIMGQLLQDADYLATDVIEQADLIVVNTCSVREKAEQKAYSLLGRLKKLKENNADLVIAVAGCVAQQDGQRMLNRVPHADLVIGPQKIYDLPNLLQRLKTPEVQTGLSPAFTIPPFLPDVKSGSQFKRFVTIMQGCNNFCTYCVVPFTRGREISRNFNDIVSEVTHLAAAGITEVTLLGQNVNSYGQDKANGAEHADLPTFPDLLRAVAAVDGIQRLRFTTSHPKDLSDELMRCFVEIDTLCPHLHLPVQTGSNRLLKLMNRKYTVADYLDKVARLRSIRPDIAITTDLIVGFPGETDDDFQATMALLEEVRYHSAFSFKYSDRPPARAIAFVDKVAEEVKSERLARLQKRQEELTLERNLAYVGHTVPVMVEGCGRINGDQWSGRAPTNHIVNFAGPLDLRPGELIPVMIAEGCLHSLRGTAAQI
jgi:tRNA-2-methylthio-N6-dimethylallyladenosine synthase